MVEKTAVKKVRKPRTKNSDNANKGLEEVAHIPKKRGRKPKGGRIVIGVTDEKEEVGIAFDNFKDHESYEKNFHQKVRNMFEDRLFGSYETHFIPSQLDPEMTLFMIEVKRSPNVVYFIDAKYSKKHQMHKEKEYYYTRVGESAIEVLKEERIKLINSFK